MQERMAKVDPQCPDCGATFPRPAMGRPPSRCQPCRQRRAKAMGRKRWLKWAAQNLVCEVSSCQHVATPSLKCSFHGGLRLAKRQAPQA